MQQCLIRVSAPAKHGSVAVVDNNEALVIRLTEKIIALITQLKKCACSHLLVVFKAMNINGLYRTTFKPLNRRR